MTSTTIIIKHPNLTSPMITVDADSTVELVQHDSGSNVWYALKIDGRHVDLVMWKHCQGRPEAMEGLEQALTTVQAAIDGLKAPVAAPQFRKEIEYSRKTRDYAMFLDGELVGYARTPGEADTTLDALVLELLNHPIYTAAEIVEQYRETAAETADMAADAAELEAEEIIADDEAAQRWYERVAQVVEETTTTTVDLPLAARSIPLAPGAHEPDDGDVKAAYREALAHPEMQTSRWQNALNRAMDHLHEDRYVVAINNQGAYCWWSVDGEGGHYTPTAATCQCTAFAKEQPCRHRSAAILLTFLPTAEESGVDEEVEEAYRLIMWEVERLAA